MGIKYDPQKNDKLEERAKEMAEYYYAKLGNMGINGVRACLHRVGEENPPLHELLVREWREIYEAHGRRPK